VRHGHEVAQRQRLRLDLVEHVEVVLGVAVRLPVDDEQPERLVVGVRVGQRRGGHGLGLGVSLPEHLGVAVAVALGLALPAGFALAERHADAGRRAQRECDGHSERLAVALNVALGVLHALAIAHR